MQKLMFSFTIFLSFPFSSIRGSPWSGPVSLSPLLFPSCLSTKFLDPSPSCNSLRIQLKKPTRQPKNTNRDTKSRMHQPQPLAPRRRLTLPRTGIPHRHLAYHTVQRFSSSRPNTTRYTSSPSEKKCADFAARISKFQALSASFLDFARSNLHQILTK